MISDGLCDQGFQQTSGGYSFMYWQPSTQPSPLNLWSVMGCTTRGFNRSLVANLLCTASCFWGATDNTLLALVTDVPTLWAVVIFRLHLNQSLDSKDDYHSGSQNVIHQQQSFWRLLSPGQSHQTNNWHSWVQTIYQQSFWRLLSPERSHKTNNWYSWVQAIYQITWDILDIQILNLPNNNINKVLAKHNGQ